MYFKLFYVVSALSLFSKCLCLGEKDEIQNHCDLLRQWLAPSSVRVELNKKGFHREVTTTVEFRSKELSSVKVLLIHRWPRDVYVDPYQLASLSDQNNWKILLDSAIDLEVPAHKASGFVTYVYPFSTGPTSKLFKVTIPIHGRYHKPSFDGKMLKSVDIEVPELLLRSEKCAQLSSLEPHTVVDAPCTASNSSTCSWVKVKPQQDLNPVSFQLPVGDGSLVAHVCGGTLLVTMICCVALSKYMWKHQVI
ncbi:phosphatidylinositol-glycan biosynthesis class X protein [Maylandia zebra]|uniref:phosphatidylinositol-glycan biosynthesis class X protein n=1 Tax=Maylandia zebra TaxID=106582 RepID=UPI000E40155F|nr:phosphatidylinositol-glycan biosynthesis class X protein [Astatotilapia calliptera]